jgi:hypothetical protein
MDLVHSAMDWWHGRVHCGLKAARTRGAAVRSFVFNVVAPLYFAHLDDFTTRH